MSSAAGSHVQTTAASPVSMAEIEGRGRALFASRPLRAGEVILRESSILVYSALPLKPPNQRQSYCSNCFRILEPSPSVVSCSSCSDAGLTLFCSTHCRSAASISSHCTWVCQALSQLRACLSSLPMEHQVQARFLVAAYNLAAVSPSHFRTLMCLQGEPPVQPEEATIFLHSLVTSLCPPPPPAEFKFSLELTSALLAKDKLNAFGLMEPVSQDVERSVRAYAIYPNASFFNHDCLPNACRFDYVDTGNTDIIVRMIHDVPEGREICLSYFPVNLNYSERQRRLREDYGFICTCDRCRVEASWSDDEQEDEDGDNGEDEAMDEDHDMVMEDSETDDGGVKEDNNFPHAYFFLRYMCSRENCWGTLAPLPPSNGTLSSLMECNVCGNIKNDEAMGGDASKE
ncbi:Histone-lysine N-methyltransferase [Bertholletia excelsa]